jgi:anti-sigma factor RsiW
MNHDDTVNMKTNDGASCPLLDAYVDGDLAAEALLRFESHLPSCPRCRDAVQQQAWIDSLLQSPELLQRESAPASLLLAASQSISVSRRRITVRRAFAATAAAAATIAAIAVWQAAAIRGPSNHASAPGSARGSIHAAASQPKSTTLQSRGLQENAEHTSLLATRASAATFVSDSDAIAVPLSSEDAQVSIVKVYPTTIAEGRVHGASLLNAGRLGQDGG